MSVDELAKKLDEARRHVQVTWDPDHAALVRVGVEQKRRRRTLVNGAAVAALFAVSISAGVIAGSRTGFMHRADNSKIAASEDRALELGWSPAKDPAPRETITEAPVEKVEVIKEPATPPAARAKRKIKEVAARQEVEPLDEIARLLELADSARNAGRSEEAAGILRRIAFEYSSDPRAPLASFTWGRLLLEQLGRPEEAAAAFARARELDPRGALAEDALAREVEAWLRAGDEARARARAAVYRELFPRGGRIQIEAP